MTYIKIKPGILLRYSFLASLVFIFFPIAFYFIPEQGLDHSWEIAIHLAFKHHLVFGKDFIFPYGPLGVLVTRLPIVISKYAYLLFDLYLLATLFFILKDIFRKHFSYGLVLFAFPAFIITSYPLPDIQCFLYFLFYLFAFINEPAKRVYLLQAALLSLIGFYIKVGTGSVEVMMLLFSLTYLFLRKKMHLIFYVAVLMGYIFCMLAGAKFLHVDLFGYLRSGLHLIADYNDAMFSQLSGDLLISAGYGALVIIVVITAWILFTWITIARKKELFAKPDDLFISGLVALSIFVLFKASFVRAAGHSLVFFEYVTLFGSLLYLYRPERISRKVAAAGCILVLIVSFWGVNKLNGGSAYKRLLKFAFVTDKFRDAGNYFTQLGDYDKELADGEKLDSGHNELKDIIGTHTVDVFPAEISKAYFNGLIYNPRPVIQSCFVNDEYLDDLNYDKYMSADAPDYILFTVEAIDDRYSFFDESMTKLAILRNYTVAGMVKSDLLLKKRPTPLDMPAAGKEETLNAKFDEDINVPRTSDLRFSRISVQYSLWGRIRRFFFLPPELKILITPSNGGPQAFRAIKPILAGGVILNKYVDKNEEFLSLMQTGGRTNTNVRKISFESEFGNAAGFVNDIRIVTISYPFSPLFQQGNGPDSLKLAYILANYKPVPLDPSLYEKDSFKVGIDSYKPEAPVFSVAGWAYREKGDNENNIMNVILRSGDKMYELPTQMLGRPDLATYFKRPDIANAGFTASVNKALFPPGTYKVGLSILDPETKKKWFSYIGANLSIAEQASIEQLSAADMVPANTGMAMGNVDTVRDQRNQFIVEGWASVKNINPIKMTTNIILKGDGIGYRVSTGKTNRKDVADFRKDPSLENAGFSTVISADRIAKGSYLVGIERIYSGGKERSLTFTTRKINL